MKVLILSLLVFIISIPAQAQSLIDFDKDGLTDSEEISIYFTDPTRADTDQDGYYDGAEIKYHYSPLFSGKTLSQSDYDNDGLSDWLELQFKTSINNPDTDNDGFSDYIEINNGFDPNNPLAKKLSQKIIIDTKEQTVTAYLNKVPLNTFLASTGKPGYNTPPGIYKIENKSERAWSAAYGLWMPYWMGFIGRTYGIHELPEWPGGFKEGQNHLGIAVSHGCVRLGVGPAKWLYNWADIGTEVEVR